MFSSKESALMRSNDPFVLIGDASIQGKRLRLFSRILLQLDTVAKKEPTNLVDFKGNMLEWEDLFLYLVCFYYHFYKKNRVSTTIRGAASFLSELLPEFTPQERFLTCVDTLVHQVFGFSGKTMQYRYYEPSKKKFFQDYIHFFDIRPDGTIELAKDGFELAGALRSVFYDKKIGIYGLMSQMALKNGNYDECIMHLKDMIHEIHRLKANIQSIETTIRHSVYENEVMSSYKEVVDSVYKQRGIDRTIINDVLSKLDEAYHLARSKNTPMEQRERLFHAKELFSEAKAEHDSIIEQCIRLSRIYQDISIKSLSWPKDMSVFKFGHEVLDKVFQANFPLGAIGFLMQSFSPISLQPKLPEIDYLFKRQVNEEGLEKIARLSEKPKEEADLFQQKLQSLFDFYFSLLDEALIGKNRIFLGDFVSFLQEAQPDVLSSEEFYHFLSLLHKQDSIRSCDLHRTHVFYSMRNYFSSISCYAISSMKHPFLHIPYNGGFKEVNELQITVQRFIKED